MKKTLTLTPGAVIEPVGNDVMVMMPGNTDILRISSPAADTLRTIVAGQPVDPSTPAVRELANQGIITTSGMSRRGLIRAGAIGAGAGIAVLAMPSVAAAASPTTTDNGSSGGGAIQVTGVWFTPVGSVNNQGFTGFGFEAEPLLPKGLGSWSIGDNGLPLRADAPSGLTGLPAELELVVSNDTFTPAGGGTPVLVNAPNGVRSYDSTNGRITWFYRFDDPDNRPLRPAQISAQFTWGGQNFEATFTGTADTVG
jgi:hypothetical protein